MDSGIEDRLHPMLFPGCAKTPETTKVFTILKDMTAADEIFKQTYIMYLVSTVLAPTSLNKVSSRCYPIMDKVDDVKNMNFSQFVSDKLHEELSVGKLSAACLLHLMLLYVDSLDVSALNIDLSDGSFVVNNWSKTDIDIDLDADMKRDLSGFGNLELKPHLAIDHRFFGGSDGFQDFIDTNCALNCPKPEHAKPICEILTYYMLAHPFNEKMPPETKRILQKHDIPYDYSTPGYTPWMDEQSAQLPGDPIEAVVLF